MKKIKNTRKVTSFFKPDKCRWKEDIFCNYMKGCRYKKNMYHEDVCIIALKKERRNA